jgi:hypothetical protein
MIEIDIPQLIADHPWVAEGFRALEDDYRMYQHEYGLSRFSYGTEMTKGSWMAVTGILVRQIATLLDMDKDDVEPNVKGFLYRRCGFVDRPKGMEEWRFGFKNAITS